MQELAKSKFSKIESRLTDKEKEEAMVRIVLNKSGADDEFRVKINLSYGGKEYFASEKDFLLESAMIRCVAELERMRRKDDVGFQSEWKEKRDMKRNMTEELMEEDWSL